MFIILLKFATNKANAGQFMDGHKAWIKQGFADGIFLMAGSLQPNQGGAVMAHNISREDLETRVKQDPFIAENVVSEEILEITPNMTDDKLKFLQG
jgi:uncharacterized protein YciI